MSILSLILVSCANPTGLTGGEKDIEPPQFDSLRTSQNYQTNFTKRPLRFTFNEWVQLKDAGSQIVVSPPLEFNPKTSIQKKTVIFEFDEKEILKEDVTYIINFGTAVKDITEGNAVKEFRYVFSTGDIIDSLEIKGKIIDAITKKPEENILVLLYQNTADSVVRKNRPFYFGKTDKSGNYKIQNLKAGTFKIFALKDENSNYKFDNIEEKIGFMDSLIQIPDTLVSRIDFEVFKEDALLSYQEEQVSYGHHKLIFTQNPKDVKLDAVFDFKSVYSQKEIHVWHNLLAKGNLIIQHDTLINDTIKLSAKGRDKFLETVELKLETKLFQKEISIQDSIKITWNHPIKSIDSNKLVLTKDTLKIPIEFHLIKSNHVRKVNVYKQLNPDTTYHLEFLPGFVTDIYGLQNDSSKISFKVLKKEAFGDIALKMDSLNNKKRYIIQLIQKDKVINTQIVNHKSSFEYHYQYLLPGNYFFKIIDDNNEDGRWTSGNYDLKKQPELIFERKLEELRANWQVEVLILGKELVDLKI